MKKFHIAFTFAPDYYRVHSTVYPARVEQKSHKRGSAYGGGIETALKGCTLQIGVGADGGCGLSLVKR